MIGVPSRMSDLARSSPRTRSVHEAGRWSWSRPGAFSFKIGAGHPENAPIRRNRKAPSCRNFNRQGRQRLLPIGTCRATALQPNTS